MPSYSNNLKNLKYKYNKLLDYEKIKNFHVYDRKQLVNNKIKIFQMLIRIIQKVSCKKKNELKKTNNSNRKTPLQFSIKLIKVNLLTGKLIKFLDMNGVHNIFLIQFKFK